MPRPNQVSGQAVGTFIAVANSTELANLDTQGIALGTQIYNIAVGQYFALSLSTAALVPDQVVSVLGVAGQRWLLVTNATNVGATFPIRNTGTPSNPVIAKTPWLNGAVQYVSSTGDDGHDGLGWDTAKATWYAAAQVIVAAGGGTIFLGPGWKAGGPVPGQGMWLNGTAMNIPGFVSAAGAKIRTIGVGGAVDNNQFGLQQVRGFGGSNLSTDYRTKPGIWMIGGEQLWTFENIGLLPTPGFEGTFGGGLFVPIREAIDYNRNVDGSIQYMVASSTARASGQTTHVVTMPTGISTATATRTGQLVTLTIPQPAGASFPRWVNGSPVWVQSTDLNYPSGAYTVTLCQSTVDSQLNWGFTYNDGTTVVGDPPLSGTITVTSPACYGGSFVEVQTTDFRVPPTQYRVVSATPTSATQATIVVTDDWGGFAGIGTGAVPATLTAGNYGVQIATLEMGYAANVRTLIKNTGSPSMSQVTNAIDVYLSGPSIHIGGTRAFYPEVEDQFLNGFFPHGTGATVPPYDKHRMASMVIIAGVAAQQGGVIIRHATGQQASIVGYFGEYISLVAIYDDCTFDTTNGYPPPPLDCYGGSNAIIHIYGRLVVADAVTGGTALLDRYYPLNLRGNYDWIVTGAAAGGVSAQGNVPEWLTTNSPFKSPWAAPGGPVIGAWPGSVLGGGVGPKLSGPHPAAWRQISPVTARFENLVPIPSTWTPAPSTGTADPMGGSGAVTYDDTIHTFRTGGQLCRRTDSFFAPGGHFVMCGWINLHGGAVNLQGLYWFICNGDLVWEPVSATGRQSDFLYRQEFGGPGWMFWYYAPKLLSGSATQTYDLFLASTQQGSGQNMDAFGIGAFWCPPTLDDNDVMEFVGTLKSQPYYLQPGMTGTFEGQPFIAHGGLGTSKHYVSGIGSGQITLGAPNTKYVELFDESGSSLGVFGPGNAFTVNP